VEGVHRNVHPYSDPDSLSVAVVYTGPKLNDKGQPIEYQRNRTATPEIDEGPDKPKATKPKPKP